MSSSHIQIPERSRRNAYEISSLSSWVLDGTILDSKLTVTGDLTFTLTLDGRDDTGHVAPTTSTAMVNIPTLLYQETQRTYGSISQRMATFSATALRLISETLREYLISGVLYSGARLNELLWTELKNWILVHLCSSTSDWNTFVTSTTVERASPIPEEDETRSWSPTGWQGGF